MTNKGQLEAAKTVVKGLSVTGGTNTEAGLQMAYNLLTNATASAAIKGIDNRFVVMLTDGKPTYHIEDYSQDYKADRDSTTQVPQSDDGYWGMDGNYYYYYVGGEGSSSSREDTKAVEDISAKLLKVAKVYGVTYGDIGTVPTANGNKAIDTWLAGDCKLSGVFSVSKPDELNKAFSDILNAINDESVSKTVVTVQQPPMTVESENEVYTFLKFLEANGAKAEDGKVAWNLGEATGTTDEAKKTTTYQMSYQVRMNTQAPGFEAKREYSLGEATLAYQVAKGDVRTAEFNDISAQGYLGELGFKKVAHESGKGLMGVQFKLINKANEALVVLDGQITINAQSDQDGEVAFKDIPSGYSYTLVETKAPNGYVASSEYWTVTVAYGVVTVTKGGEEVTLDKVENTLDPQPKDIEITKTWQAPTETVLPESITLNLLRKAEDSNADPVKVATITASEDSATIALEDGITGITVKSASNWVYTVNAPSVDVETGAKWAYSVTEDEVSGYTSSVDGLRVTNTITGETSFTVTKEWILPAGETAPEVKVTLQADGEDLDIKTLNDANKWTYTWSELPVYNNKGEKITYSASEAPLGTGYTQDTEIPAANGTKFVNTVSNQLTEYTVTKTWKDGDGTDRPESITVVLLRNGKTFTSAQLNADNNWSHIWKDLPVYTFTREDGTLKSVTKNAYTVKEVNAPAGYVSSVSGNTITNTRTGGITQLTATKAWDDGEYTSFTHGEVTFKLYRSSNGSDFTYVAGEDRTVAETATWTGLPQYDENGYAYTYKVVEEAVAGYDTSYSTDGGIFVNGTVTVTNTLKDIKDNETEVTVNKTWLGEATEDVTFYLYQNKQGETVGAEQVPFRTEVLAKGQGSLTFTNLPKQYRVQNEDGSIGEADYVYTVVEVAGENFEQVGKANIVETVNGWTWTFTNLNTEKTSFDVTKVWQDMDANQRGEAVITLYRKVGETKDETFSQEWKTKANESHTFTGLAKYDSEGHPYTYYVEETTVPGGYTSSVNGETVTNTLNQANINKVIQKVWVDGGKANADRPAITVNLLRDGTKIATVTVKNDGTVVAPEGYTVEVNTGANPWVITFEGLPQYNDARTAEYVYTVSEEQVEGYQTTVNGDTITNTLPQANVSYTLTKYWVDGNNENETRPEKLVFDLTATANGKPVTSVDGKAIPSTVELTAANVVENHPNTWSKALNLPSLSDERYPISYTLTEGVLDGYTSEALASTGNDFQFRNTLAQDNSISVTANKDWNNSYEGFLTDEQKPVDVDSIYVGLYRKSGTNGFALVDGSIQKMTKAGEWTVTWNNLPKYDSNGFAYQYQVFEGSYTTDDDGKQAWIRAESTISFNGRTYQVSYETKGNDTTITNTFKAPTQYYYTVVGNYTTYLDGQKVASASASGVVLVSITGLTASQEVTVNAADYTKYDNATFTYLNKGSLQIGNADPVEFTTAEYTVTLDQANKLYTITLNYERRTNTPYTPSTSYTVTVNYYDIDTGAVIHQKYQTSGTAYSSYDVTAQDKIAITGYTYVETTGDALTGTLNGSKAINVYYTKDSDIDDGNTPTTPAEPGSDIGDDDVPTTPAQPPKTGDSMGLWIAAAMVSGMGLIWLSLSGKKRKEEV